jgi:TrmH family RNA methyltransferase
VQKCLARVLPAQQHASQYFAMTHHPTITSTSNRHVKYIRGLVSLAKERRRDQVFVIEGPRLVAEALRAGADLRLAIYAADQLATSPEGRELVRHLAIEPVAYPANPEIVAAAADTVHPQGVVAVAAWPELEARRGPIVVLDAVQDPGNLGTLLRSAEAAGAGLLLCAPGTADIFNPKVVRAASGAHFHLPLRTATWNDIADILSTTPHIYAGAADAQMPYFAADWRQPAALIIGNEAHGIGAEAAALTTRRISIPMEGRAESLNAAVAGSIILFEALRQRSRGRT